MSRLHQTMADLSLDGSITEGTLALIYRATLLLLLHRAGLVNMLAKKERWEEEPTRRNANTSTLNSPGKKGKKGIPVLAAGTPNSLKIQR